MLAVSRANLIPQAQAQVTRLLEVNLGRIQVSDTDLACPHLMQRPGLRGLI
jgi:hypothetical protein